MATTKVWGESITACGYHKSMGWLFYLMRLPQQYGVNLLPRVPITTVWCELFIPFGYHNRVGWIFSLNWHAQQYTGWMFYTLWLPQQYGLNRFPCMATTTVWDESFTPCGYCSSMGVNLLWYVTTTTVWGESFIQVATITVWGEVFTPEIMYLPHTVVVARQG